MRSTPRRSPLRRSVPMAALLLLPAWALLANGGARPELRAELRPAMRAELRAAGVASLPVAPTPGATGFRATVFRAATPAPAFPARTLPVLGRPTPAFPKAALHAELGAGLPALNAPPPLSPAAHTLPPLPLPPALPPHTPTPTPSPHVPTRHPGVPVAETGAPVREAEDHSSALVPIALGLALTGAAVYKHRGLPGGH